jgi:hypothetical protein
MVRRTFNPSLTGSWKNTAPMTTPRKEVKTVATVPMTASIAALMKTATPTAVKAVKTTTTTAAVKTMMMATMTTAVKTMMMATVMVPTAAVAAVKTATMTCCRSSVIDVRES